MKRYIALFLLSITVATGQAVSFDLGGNEGGSTTGKILQLLFTLTAIGLAPFIIMTVTSFTRIMVVLSFLRSAIGLQQSPPNMVLTALALFLTSFVMEPVFKQAYESGIEPLMAERITEKEALGK